MAFEHFKSFIRRVRNMFGSGFINSVAEVARESTATSNVMMENIDLWLNMYCGNAPWIKEGDTSLELPVIIASEIARAVTLEMEINVSGSPMAEYLEEQLKQLMVNDNIRLYTEYACAGGGLVFKPSVFNENIVIEAVQANAFYPVGFDSSQKITSAYFIYRKWKGRKVYNRLEKHELEGDVYKITNTAYVSAVEDALGKPCSLTEVEEWADIEPEVTINDIKAPLFAYFKIPQGNSIDLRSPLGVSVYSRAVKLIKKADEQFDSLCWEYKGGELAIDASEDAFRMFNGEPMLPEGKERLYRRNNLDADTTGGDSLLKEWAPALRDSNYMAGLNDILIKIENACHISRGTLSDPNEIAKTATELKMMKNRSYSTISDIQRSLEQAINDLVYSMYCLAVLYDLAPDGEYTTTFVWDDSIIVDAEAERMRDQQEVSQGLMAKWEYRCKWYGEDEATAKLKVKEIDGGLSDDEILGFGANETQEETELAEGEGSNEKGQR